MTLTTVPDKTIGDVFTESMWDTYIRDNINELIGRSTRNLLVNGGFEWWQRGAGAFTANNAYSADRWQLKLTSGTLTVTQETTTIDAIQASSLKAVSTSPVGHKIVQRVEDVKAYRGKTIALSMRVQKGLASGCSISITDSSSSTTGSGTATTGSFQTITVTKTIDAAATTLDIEIAITAAGTYYFDNAMLVIGPNATEYVPLTPQEDLARCQRYYEVHGGVNDEWPIISGYANAGTVDRWASLVFAVPKGGIPTATKNGTWGVVNCAQPTISAVTTAGYSIKAVSTGAGEVAAFPNSTDDTLTFDWAP